MDRPAALAWLARRQVWEDRLRELEAPGSAPSRLVERIRPRADANPGRAVREHAPVKWAS